MIRFAILIEILQIIFSVIFIWIRLAAGFRNPFSYQKQKPVFFVPVSCAWYCVIRGIMDEEYDVIVMGTGLKVSDMPQFL